MVVVIMGRLISLITLNPFLMLALCWMVGARKREWVVRRFADGSADLIDNGRLKG